MAVAVRVFRDEEIVADQKRRLHRSRGNVEWLKQEGANDEGNQERMNDDADGFAQAAFGFGAGCHAHGFLTSCFPLPVARLAAAENCPHATSNSPRLEEMTCYERPDFDIRTPPEH